MRKKYSHLIEKIKTQIQIHTQNYAIWVFCMFSFFIIIKLNKYIYFQVNKLMGITNAVYL